MSHNLVSSIEQFITQLRQQIQLEIQNNWRDVTLLDIEHNNLTKIDLNKCPTAVVNEQGYLVFPQGRQIKWLAQNITIPDTLRGYPLSGLSLRLVLTWWAEDAQIFINGKLVQQGDLFDSSARVLITEDAQPGQEYLVTIRLVSPNHDIGALMRSHLRYEKLSVPHNIDPGLIADELTVLLKYISQFESEHLEVLATELAKFDWRNLKNADGFVYDLAKLRSNLLPLAGNIKRRCFNLLGHAHLDMAWLWTTDETYEVAERTFKSVLNLQQDFPTLIFGHTSPALYQWIEINRPQLFKEIQNAVRLNKWEILGGMWIEPETNLVCGESLIRQLLYGQQYYQEKFGEISQVAWLPDSFGFTWQLPQIFQQCGIEYFVTGKLHWNDTTQFPHGCFWWSSPDGTQLLTLMSPPNVTGVMDTNPITMTNYAIDWEIQTGLPEIFWLPGVGDHGGGPTRDMLEVAHKWHNSPFFPEIKFSTASDYLAKIIRQANNDDYLAQSRQDAKDISGAKYDFPVWKDELYLELHRGCYTVHGEQKKYNRHCERLLYQAELWSTLATLLCGDRLVIQPLFSNIKTIIEKEGFCQADPQQLIEIAWKKVLFNQFHDILPGTSIPEVFIEANQNWETAIAIGENILENALNAIALSIDLSEPPQSDAIPLVVFNSLNWQRSEIITITDKKFATDNLVFWICSDRGERIDSALNQVENQLGFLAQDIPGVGYRLFWLCQEPATAEQAFTIKSDINYQLENDYLQVIVNQKTGDLTSIFDKINHKEILSQAGNKIQAFADQGQYWDAWNIDPEYAQKQLSDTKLKSIEWLENNSSKQIIRVVKQFNQSEFIQDYILELDSTYLKIANTVNWQETHVMIKVAFPLNLTSDHGTCEIPCGTIDRTTKPQTAAEQAKWEFSALNWVDLTDNNGEYGVSLLNDGKYGYDAQPNQLRLTLLRSPLWPDPQSDKGIHHFTYAIYPHQYSWKEAKTVQKAYELNTPLQTVLLDKYQQDISESNLLPSKTELLNLSADNLILMALKLSSKQEIIMRCYEAHGLEANLNLRGNFDWELSTSLNCLERENIPGEQCNKIKPYKITTFKLKRKKYISLHF